MSKKFVKATRIKTFNNRFGLYRLETIEGLNVVDEHGKPTTIPNGRNVIGVDHLHFTGWAKGKTGAHRLDADNTNEIIVGTVRVMSDGKLIANDWYLINQDEIDKLYSQRVEFNI